MVGKLPRCQRAVEETQAMYSGPSAASVNQANPLAHSMTPRFARCSKSCSASEVAAAICDDTKSRSGSHTSVHESRITNHNLATVA
jgi:hypothetical protein